jgi:hypothetical protein
MGTAALAPLASLSQHADALVGSLQSSQDINTAGRLLCLRWPFSDFGCLLPLFFDGRRDGFDLHLSSWRAVLTSGGSSSLGRRRFDGFLYVF